MKTIAYNRLNYDINILKMRGWVGEWEKRRRLGMRWRLEEEMETGRRDEDWERRETRGLKIGGKFLRFSTRLVGP